MAGVFQRRTRDHVNHEVTEQSTQTSERMKKLHEMIQSEPLRNQLLEAIREFSANDSDPETVMATILGDVQKAQKEAMEIFPVCHHSPASAHFIVRRIHEKRPKVIFMELCEDLRPVVDELRECKLPVALQAFALETDGFPERWSPLSIVAPITEFSAEYQAISYALENDVELIFVDRSCDHVFQWLPQNDEALETSIQAAEQEELDSQNSEEKEMHGSSIGIQIGKNRPTFREFEKFLLENANVHHYSEWWDQYVEEPLIGEDYETYRQMMFFIGSLLRRLGQDRDKGLRSDQERERYMWQRMKEYMRKEALEVSDCLYICGAFHAASDVEEFGIHSEKEYEITERSKTKWLYGVIPSSHSAIEHQFGQPIGSVSIAATSWTKGLKSSKLKPFKLGRKKKPIKLATSKETTTEEQDSGVDKLVNFLGKTPERQKADLEQLIGWSTDIVRLARKNGYLASTADSIAIYQTSILLANLRNREHPSPYDFREAAITCLEKDMTPKKRNIEQICDILLGGDRIGTVGYSSLPPLAQEIYDRLEPLNINLTGRTIQRALLDFKKNPELLPCSDLLWKLRYLIDSYIVRPIMGERSLGYTPVQESWDIAIGKYQRDIIELGYEGITVEYVIEKRLKHSVYHTKATAVTGLRAVEDCILFLKSPRLTEELGEQSVALIAKEDSIKEAPEIFKRIRQLLHYYRGQGEELPHWLNDFIVTGYSHYCTMLPGAFLDEDVNPSQICAMLGFIMTLENLSLSLGCSREQFLIAIKLSQPETPAKLSLLWTAEYILSMKELEEMRAYFDHLLDNPMRLASFPEYLSGFVLALDFTASITQFIVELFSKAFEKLPDTVLFPWLPKLILALRKEGSEMMPKILKEAAALLPKRPEELDTWQPIWKQKKTEKTGKQQKANSQKEKAPLNEEQKAIHQLLATWPESMDSMADLLGLEKQIIPSSQSDDTEEQTESGELKEQEKTLKNLLSTHNETTQAMLKLLSS